MQCTVVLAECVSNKNKTIEMTLDYFLRYFTSFYNARYGNCYTFNSGWNASNELREAYRAGPQYG